jgi:hypothetical protein
MSLGTATAMATGRLAEHGNPAIPFDYGVRAVGQLRAISSE